MIEKHSWKRCMLPFWWCYWAQCLWPTSSWTRCRDQPRSSPRLLGPRSQPLSQSESPTEWASRTQISGKSASLPGTSYCRRKMESSRLNLRCWSSSAQSKASTEFTCWPRWPKTAKRWIRRRRMPSMSYSWSLWNKISSGASRDFCTAAQKLATLPRFDI